MKRMFCFTLDDNIQFFEEICRNESASIFDCAYLGMLKRCHNRFGCKVQLNMFYSYAPGTFSLAEVPGRYREEFEKNAGWLKLSFHARHNDPPFPYEFDQEALARDYLDVTCELLRIAGTRSLAKTTTLHYAAATAEGCEFLRQSGVRGLIGMFYSREGREALHYHLPPSEWNDLRSGSFYLDQRTGMCFAHNDLILNQHSLSSALQQLRELDGLVAKRVHVPFVQLMTHEQYFYPGYQDYQPDFEEKIAAALAFLGCAGYTSCFLEELL